MIRAMLYWPFFVLLIKYVRAASVWERNPAERGDALQTDSFPHMRPIASSKPQVQTTDFSAMAAAVMQAPPPSTHASAQGADWGQPKGYSLVFGPIYAATSAPGYMGFSSLGAGNYNVTRCAEICNSRASDAVGGACKFFNIWQGVNEYGQATDVICAMYYIPTDGSTATNRGNGYWFQILYSQGYVRNSFLPDGGFEALPACSGGQTSCSANGDATWTLVTTSTSTNTASQLLRLSGAHSGSVFATIGFYDATNTGIWTPASPISTEAGRNYLVTFYHRLTGSLTSSGLSTNFAMLWNGVPVLSPRPTDFNWHYYEVQVVAAGNDILAFKDDFPNSQIATSAIDDIFVFLTN